MIFIWHLIRQKCQKPIEFVKEHISQNHFLKIRIVNQYIKKLNLTIYDINPTLSERFLMVKLDMRFQVCFLFHRFDFSISRERYQVTQTLKIRITGLTTSDQ